jgi:hypothetical protein
MMAVKPGLDFLDTLNLYDCGAMYPQELSRVELLFKAEADGQGSVGRAREMTII